MKLYINVPNACKILGYFDLLGVGRNLNTLFCGLLPLITSASERLSNSQIFRNPETEQNDRKAGKLLRISSKRDLAKNDWLKLLSL